jgi:hypothetical protein
MAKTTKTSERVSKDRTYVLRKKNAPMQFFLRNRHKKQSPLQYFDEEKNQLRTLCYSSNQLSIFEDEQQGDVLLGSIIFMNGRLTVPKSNPQLQKFLELTPDNGLVFEEFKPDEIAEKQISALELEMQALQVAMELKPSEMESIALTVFGSSVLKKKTAEIKRDLFVYAKDNPEHFLLLANDDMTKLKGLAVRAQSLNLCQYKSNAFYNNDTLLCKVPFDETDKYNTLASWMNSTDEGKAFLKFIETKIK